MTWKTLIISCSCQVAFVWMPLDTNHLSNQCCRHLLITTTLPDGSGPPAGQCALTHHTAQEQLEEHNKDPQCWLGLQIPQIPIWSSICKTCWSRVITLLSLPSRMLDGLLTLGFRCNNDWNCGPAFYPCRLGGGVMEICPSSLHVFCGLGEGL